MENIIEQYYEQYNYPSVDKLYKYLKADGHKTTKKYIDEYLSKKNEVQQFKEVKKSKKKMGHILSNSPNEKWQLDIFYLIKYHKQNHGYKYILACIDIFTRKAYAIPLKLKDDENVSEGIKEIIKQAQTTPYFITSDSDSTFLSGESNKIFHKYDIIHNAVPVGDHASLGVIDRFARTLKTILHKRFVKYNSTNWVDNLSKIIEQYNNSPHSAINDIKPNDADKPENISKIIDLNVEKRKEKTTFINEFKEGDKVRILLTGFHKKSEGQFSDEVYTVKEARGKTVILTDGQIKKYDMLLKVHKDTNINIINKSPIIKANREYKQEKVLKKEGIDQTNIIEGKRNRIQRVV